MTRFLPRVFRSISTAGAVVLLITITLVACSDQGLETPTSPPDVSSSQARSGPSIFLQQQDLGPALAAQRRNGARLMAIPGVVGHAVGLVDGKPGIRVFLLTPDVADIPERLENLPVGLEVTGMFVAGDVNNPQTRERPAPNGFSIGHPDITAGTLGAIVMATDGSGTCYALSNNHVLANSNQASIGDPSLQPGPYDGGTDPADAIGTLAAFKPISFNGSDNDIDAAISELFDVADVTAATPSYAYGAPKSTTVGPSLNLPVKKFGRTTDLTYGTVNGLSATVSICYECANPVCTRCRAAATFTDQITTSDMSDGGDSGSLIVTATGNNPVGLLFAGSSTTTIANPIDAVLGHFGVTVVSSTSGCTNSGGTLNTRPVVTITSPSDGSAFDDGESITFAGTAFDTEDGDLTASLVWTSDVDGGIGTGGSFTTNALSVGTHAITASVTDSGNETGSNAVTVIVNPVGGSDIILTANGYKVRGVRYVDLVWSGASTRVDIFRNGSPILVDTSNDGEETDDLRRSSGTFTYKVCETGTSICSNTATVVF